MVHKLMKWDRLGPYTIDQRVGRGGMGVVYSAATDVTGERVAVKVLQSTGDDDGLSDRFAAEIESLRMLQHANIVRILGYGEEQECRYYAMELVDGMSLQDLLERGEILPWQESTRIGVQICRALKHAHDHGIIHRDIKPANLLLTRDGTVKLSDFGIAKLFGNSGQTADGGVIGTAEYMAPEQADGRPVTYRSDLYSLGGVLYALLAGRPPFRAKSLVEMLQLQRFAEPEPVIRLNPTVPRALNDLVNHLLAKDPAKRVPTALVAGRQLESMLAYDQSVNGAPRPLRVAPKISPTPAAPAREPSGDAAHVTHEPVAGGSPAAADDLRFSVGHKDLGETPAAPHAGPDDASDVILAGDPSSVLGGNGATADFRVAPPVMRSRGEVSAAPNVDRSMGVSVARTFIPVGTEDRGLRRNEAEESTPWISPGTWALVFAMLAVGLTVWYWLQPPEAESLYEEVTAASADGKVERLIDVESKINAFINHYPGDRRVREMQGYLDEIELYRLERRFEFRSKFLSKNDGLQPVERMYFEALGYLHLDPELGRKKLQALVDLFRDAKDGSKQTRECLQLAQKQLDRLDRQMPQQVSADRKLLEEKLIEAGQLDSSDPAAAHRMRAAIVELYGNEAWASGLVDQARAALDGSEPPVPDLPTAER
ncbi:MAG: hypothetical protein C0483_09490 [Pirellula sp.]|nr:hypothetical protein [Pirellula sp.]